MDELVVPLPSPLYLATHVRASVLLVSLQGIAHHGAMDAYRRHLPEHAHADMFSLAGGAWASADIAVTHYRTCDALDFTIEQRIAVGTYAATRLHEGFLKLAVRMSREAGVTPWTALRHTRDFYDQLWKGGGIEVRKRGPKDAYVGWRGQPCFVSKHFAYGFVGLLQDLILLYSRRAVIEIDEASHTKSSCGFTVAWA